MKQTKRKGEDGGELPKPEVKVRWFSGTHYIEPEALARSTSFKETLSRVAELRRKRDTSGGA